MSLSFQEGSRSAALAVLVLFAVTLAANAAPVPACSLALMINLFPSYNPANFPADCLLTIGNVQLTFSAFAVSNGAPASPPVLLSAFTQNGGEYALNFNPQMSAAGQDTALYERWTLLGGYFGGVDLHDVGQGQNFMITENICAGAPGAAPCTGTLARLTVWNFGPGDQQISQFASIAGNVSVLSIVKDINLPMSHHGALTAAGLSGFSQTFAVPEPLSLVLFGAGLLALGLLLRRTRR